VLGTYISNSQLVCKPPKFLELGNYLVQVSMDGGQRYLSESFPVFIYRDILILQQNPAILDIRSGSIDKLVLVRQDTITITIASRR
jgi:hypothetical protein